jgi:hypothetical protein
MRPLPLQLSWNYISAGSKDVTGWMDMPCNATVSNVYYICEYDGKYQTGAKRWLGSVFKPSCHSMQHVPSAERVPFFLRRSVGLPCTVPTAVARYAALPGGVHAVQKQQHSHGGPWISCAVVKRPALHADCDVHMEQAAAGVHAAWGLKVHNSAMQRVGVAHHRPHLQLPHHHPDLRCSQHRLQGPHFPRRHRQWLPGVLRQVGRACDVCLVMGLLSERMISPSPPPALPQLPRAARRGGVLQVPQRLPDDVLLDRPQAGRRHLVGPVGLCNCWQRSH